MLDRSRTAEKDTSSEVSRIALRTLGILAGETSGRTPAPLESYAKQLQQAVLAARPAQMDDLVSQMRRALISPAEIAEVYVPLVARRLGACWIEDSLDFSAVSIGSARLQSLLWRLESLEAAQTPKFDQQRASMLVVVPEKGQHTLGATVLAGQLRRRGLAVKLELDVRPSALADSMRARAFAGVMISASSREPLENLAELVDTARQSQANTPVLIGGNVIEQMTDVQKATQADFVTSDVETALRYCGFDEARRPDGPIPDAG